MPELLEQHGRDTEVARSNVAEATWQQQRGSVAKDVRGKVGGEKARIAKTTWPKLLEQRGRDTEVAATWQRCRSC
jgi:hypothetical protein